MNRSRIIIGLGVAVVLQLFILLGTVGRATIPLWTGKEIRVKTVPRDPRSMFRGNYARLNYDIARVHKKLIDTDRQLRRGEIIYVSLEPGDDGLHHIASASLDKPNEGVFLRGRISRVYSSYTVKYGIEAYFAPKKKALQLEKDLRKSGVAVLMVTDSGRVTLKDVVPNSPKN
jgi:uncharacterized membrane-anchored protein